MTSPNILPPSDLALSNPLGAVPAIRPQKKNDLNIKVPFAFSLNPSTDKTIAVFAHIFYPALAAEICSYLNNIPFSFDLYISTDASSKISEIKAAFVSSRTKNIVIKEFPNKGRDIAPFIVGFAEQIPLYDIILHIHSKRSPHDSDLSRWREYSYDALLGNEDIVRSVVHILSETDTGIVYPDHFRPVRKSINFGFDFDLMQELLGRLGVSISKDVILDFPAGSMFWGRSKALAPLLNLDLKFEDFPDELGQVDGTLAHALERSLLFIAEKSGHGWCRITTESGQRNLPVFSSSDLDFALARVGRHLTGNRYGLFGANASVQEVSGIGVRPDRGSKPRLTVLLPTLVPEKVFGGISTALKVFKVLMAQLGDEFDYRIVSLNDPVSMQCMGIVPDFTLTHIDARSGCVARSVVDASGRNNSQLQIRPNEFFLATAWWTAADAHRFIDMQGEMFGRALPLIYLIQDHEPDFYGWSSRYGMAKATYTQNKDIIALINSEELCNFMLSRYSFDEVFCIPFEMNATLASKLSSKPKERSILVYGRPEVARNAFDVLMDGLCLWQQNNPMKSREWRILSAGDTYPYERARHIHNLEILGKLSLNDYADTLAKASIGISLMLSPHPSYPPLEMAEAGILTITNTYDCKDLTRRSPNIRTIEECTPEAIAAMLDTVVAEAEASRLGKTFPQHVTAKVDNDFRTYDPKSVADLIRARLQNQATG